MFLVNNLQLEQHFVYIIFLTIFREHFCWEDACFQYKMFLSLSVTWVSFSLSKIIFWDSQTAGEVNYLGSSL